MICFVMVLGLVLKNIPAMLFLLHPSVASFHQTMIFLFLGLISPVKLLRRQVQDCQKTTYSLFPAGAGGKCILNKGGTDHHGDYGKTE